MRVEFKRRRKSNTLILFFLFATSSFLTIFTNLAYSGENSPDNSVLNEDQNISVIKDDNNKLEDSDSIDFSPPIFEVSSINKWSKITSVADQDQDGLNDNFDEKLKEYGESKPDEVSELREIPSLSKTQIIRDLFSNKKKPLEESSEGPIAVVASFPSGDITSIIELFEELGGKIKSTYDMAINGFAGEINYNGLIQYQEKLKKSGCSIYN